MQIFRMLSRLLVIMLIALVIAACGSGNAPAPEPTDVPPTAESEAEPTEVPAEDSQAAEATEATEEVAAEEPTDVPPTATPLPITSDGSDGRILAWVAPAVAPGRQSANSSGELVYFAPDGGMESIMTLPTSTTRVTACGNNSTSPDNNTFAFMTTVSAGGRETANLHLIKGISPDIQTVAEDLNPISCVGSSGFQFAPDSSRFGFIDWTDEANNAVSPIGRLLIYNTDSIEQIANIENVTDFQLTDSGAYFVSFFLNSDNEANEVGIFSWDGNNDSEVATLRAEENCTYTSASVAEITTAQIAVILGYSCVGGGGTDWQLHLVNIDNKTAQLEIAQDSGGRYFGFSDTNAIWTSPDGQTLWFTVPDGASNQSVSLYATSIESIDPTQIIDRFALVETVSDLPYDANNATAQVSPDGNYLAIVRNDGNNDAVLNVVNLSDMSVQPVQFDAGERGYTIADVAFDRDSQQLVFVAGADEGENNVLYKMDLATGTDSNISRGRFAQVAISPDASQIAAMNWFVYDDEEAPYLQLVVIDAASGAETIIFEGGEVDAEGKLINQQFAYPLSWRTP